jgi:hypothetical protein
MSLGKRLSLLTNAKSETAVEGVGKVLISLRTCHRFEMKNEIKLKALRSSIGQSFANRDGAMTPIQETVRRDFGTKLFNENHCQGIKEVSGGVGL